MTEKKTKNNKPRNKPKRNKKGQLEKGSTANPNGAPKKAETWKALIARKMREAEGEVSTKEVIIEQQIKLAKKGDKNAVAFLANREEGMPQQYIEQTNTTEAEVRIIE